MPPGFGYRITTFRESNAQRGGHGSCRVVHLRFAGDGRSGFTITTHWRLCGATITSPSTYRLNRRIIHPTYVSDNTHLIINIHY